MVKSYIISISLCTGCYRHIRISASATLFRLHQAILNAFDFEDDHAHGFFMDNRIWSHYDAYFSMELKGDERLTTEYTLESLKLQIGDKFKYLFDFGDEWVFQCKVLRELEEATDLPGVVRSVGNAPGQHQGEDWDINEEDAEGELPARSKPDRIKAMFQALTLPKAVTENLRRYFDAAANLYGIIPVKKLMEIYNSQNSPVSQEDFLAVAEILRHSDTAFYILGEEELYRDGKASSPLNREIISMIMVELDWENYYQLCAMQNGKDWAALPKEELLAYADLHYWPRTPQNIKMLRFLEKRQNQLEGPAEAALKTIHVMIWAERFLEEILEAADAIGLRFHNEREANEFIQLFQEMNNHTRKIANCGYTPAEMAAKEQEKRKKLYGARFALRNPNQISLFEKK